MNLLGAASALQQIADIFGAGPDAEQSWAADENAFWRHFGASYEEFCATLGHLDEEQSARFAATLEVNPEAAVLWVLAMEPE